MRTTDILLLFVIQTSAFQNALGNTMTIPELPPGFPCEREGKFPVLNSCKDYYQCLKVNDGFFVPYPSTFTCPQGTVFDTNLELCHLASLSTSRTECNGLSAEATPSVAAPSVATPSVATPSVAVPSTAIPSAAVPSAAVPSAITPSAVATPTATSSVVTPLVTYPSVIAPSLTASSSLCNQDLTVQMAPAILGYCRFMSAISDSVLQITSYIPLRPSLRSHKEFNKFIPEYNEVLAKTQQDVRIWRRNNDIFSNMKRALFMARQYGSEFQRKYQLNKERRRSQYLSGEEKAAQHIQDIQNDIRTMEKEIADLEAIISQTPVAAVLSYLKNSIANKQKRIEEKKREIQQASAIGRELEELTAFLELVRNDAVPVKEMAESLAKRLEQLYNVLEGDAASIVSLTTIANAKSGILQVDGQNLQVEVQQNKKELESLEERKREKEAMLTLLNDASNSKANEVRNMFREIDRKTEDFEKRKAQICPLGDILGPSPQCKSLQSEYNRAVGRDLDRVKILNKELSSLNQQRRRIVSEIEAISGDLSQGHAVASGSDGISQVESEVEKFVSIVRELTSLSDETRSLMLLVTEATEALHGVRDTFNDISRSLNDMITRAKSPENDLERQNVILIIDSGLMTLKCQAEQIHDGFRELEECI